MHLRRRRVVLNELDQLISEHDAARGDGEIAAHGERALIAHRDAAFASSEPLQQTCAVRLQRALQHFRIRRGEIRRRDRVEILARREFESTFVVRRKLRQRRERFHIFRIEQVSIFEKCVVGLIAPRGRGETAIAIGALGRFG